MRSYADEIHVAVEPEGDRPVSFVWHGRLYTVREVLDRWVERTPWWRLALTGGGSDECGRCGAESGGGVSPRMQEQVWRVEAAPGRLLDGGVYDLACSEPGWQLRRVSD